MTFVDLIEQLLVEDAADAGLPKQDALNAAARRDFGQLALKALRAMSKEECVAASNGVEEALAILLLQVNSQHIDSFLAGIVSEAKTCAEIYRSHFVSRHDQVEAKATTRQAGNA